MPEPEDQSAQPQPLVPEDAMPGSVPAEDDAQGLAEDAVPAEEMPQGLRWSWDLDFDALMAALSEPAPWNRPVRPAPPQQASPPATDAGPASDRTDPAADGDTDGPPSDAASASDPASTTDAACGQNGAVEPSPAVSNSDPAAAGASAPDVDPVEVEFAEMLEAIEASGSQPLPLAVVAGESLSRCRPAPIWPDGWPRARRSAWRMARWPEWPRRTGDWRRGLRPESSRWWLSSPPGLRPPMHELASTRTAARLG